MQADNTSVQRPSHTRNLPTHTCDRFDFAAATPPTSVSNPLTQKKSKSYSHYSSSPPHNTDVLRKGQVHPASSRALRSPARERVSLPCTGTVLERVLYPHYLTHPIGIGESPIFFLISFSLRQISLRLHSSAGSAK